LDASGNVYVAGETFGALPGQKSAGLYDAYVRKYDSAGAEHWTRQLGAGSNDYGFSVSVDGSGSVYLAGYTDGALPGQSFAGYYDAFIARLIQ
jgi:hypothetical protein